jgi:type IV pilus assembly protein PilM
VHADGVPLIVRTIPRGGTEITELIAKRLEIDVDAAEALKCRVGLSTADGESTTVVEAIRDGVRPLLNEVRSSFVYLTTGGGQRRVARLVLSGGDPVARLRDERPDPSDGFPPSAAVSVGLALGAAA